MGNSFGKISTKIVKLFINQAPKSRNYQETSPPNLMLIIDFDYFSVPKNSKSRISRISHQTLTDLSQSPKALSKPPPQTSPFFLHFAGSLVAD
jgi:hypothetical protein